jgi:hypothetical protein
VKATFRKCRRAILLPYSEISSTIRSRCLEAYPRLAAAIVMLKEVIGHITDGERILAYRALRFARGDATPLAGYEQDDYVLGGGFERRSLKDLIDEFETVRRATSSLFSSFDGEAWSRRGIANENEMSVRGIAYVLAGHERHHLEILRAKYLI